MSDLALIRARLEAWEFEPGGRDSFSRRLARENGWSRDHTARVIAEYERFLMLVSTSDDVICPSDAVDQAWHLHLLHTREYRRFCRTVLGRPLHHTPSQGGSAEQAKYREAYTRTLDLYRATFSEDPPADVWPPVERRFDPESAFVRVDAGAHFIVRKPLFVRRAAARVTALTSLPPRAIATLAGCSVLGCASSDDRWAVTGPTFLGLFFTGWATSLLAAFYLQRVGSRDGDPIPEFDGYHAAYLAHGEGAVVEAAIAVLVASGAASFDDAAGTLRAVAPIAPGAHPLEATIHARLSHDTPLPVAELRSEATALTAGIAERLKQLGLVTDTPSRVPLALALAVPLLGVGRIISRIGTPYPVGLLVFSTFVGLVVAFLVFRPSPRTPAGHRALRELKARHASLPKSAPTSELAASGALPLVVGLFGIATLGPSLELDGFKNWLSRSTSEGGGGCGGGCSPGDAGGGGCGGGCGGCGGCG
jgi:uncharacterized protein (TIGR04222 family)